MVTIKKKGEIRTTLKRVNFVDIIPAVFPVKPKHATEHKVAWPAVCCPKRSRFEAEKLYIYIYIYIYCWFVSPNWSVNARVFVKSKSIVVDLRLRLAVFCILGTACNAHISLDLAIYFSTPFLVQFLTPCSLSPSDCTARRLKLTPHQLLWPKSLARQHRYVVICLETNWSWYIYICWFMRFVLTFFFFFSLFTYPYQRGMVL